MTARPGGLSTIQIQLCSPFLRHNHHTKVPHHVQLDSQVTLHGGVQAQRLASIIGQVISMGIAVGLVTSHSTIVEDLDITDDGGTIISEMG